MLHVEFHLTLGIGKVSVESAHFVQLFKGPDGEQTDDGKGSEWVVRRQTGHALVQTKEIERKGHPVRRLERFAVRVGKVFGKPFGFDLNLVGYVCDGGDVVAVAVALAVAVSFVNPLYTVLCDGYGSGHLIPGAGIFPITLVVATGALVSVAFVAMPVVSVSGC